MFSAFLELEVGGKSPSELLAELDETRCGVSDLAAHILRNATWKVGERTTIKFAQEKISSLGFSEKPSDFHTVRDRILKLGHQLCNWTDCADLALKHPRFSEKTFFWCASQSLFERSEDVFWLENRNGLRIGADRLFGTFLRLDFNVVFRL